MKAVRLAVLEGAFAIHRLPPEEEIPALLLEKSFVALTRTAEELSIVCPETIEITGAVTETGWSCLQVAGPLDFSLTGILAGLSQTLAAAEISLFAVSTFDTDYLLVRTRLLDRAIAVLRQAGYQVA